MRAHTRIRPPRARRLEAGRRRESHGAGPVHPRLAPTSLSRLGAGLPSPLRESPPMLLVYWAAVHCRPHSLLADAIVTACDGRGRSSSPPIPCFCCFRLNSRPSRFSRTPSPTQPRRGPLLSAPRCCFFFRFCSPKKLRFCCSRPSPPLSPLCVRSPRLRVSARIPPRLRPLCAPRLLPLHVSYRGTFASHAFRIFWNSGLSAGPPIEG